jgi:hypothetical protein
LFTSHGAAISNSGSRQLTQWENGKPVSSDCNHSSIERMPAFKPEIPASGIQ